MPWVDLIDETFIVAEPRVIAAHVHDPDLWRRWWPELDVTVAQDRGEAGLRFTVSGAFVGTSEIWLEPFGDGVILHYYLRAEPVRSGRRVDRVRRRHAVAVKSAVSGLKDALEAGRPAGTGRPGFSPAPELPTTER